MKVLWGWHSCIQLLTVVSLLGFSCLLLWLPTQVLCYMSVQLKYLQVLKSYPSRKWKVPFPGILSEHLLYIRGSDEFRNPLLDFACSAEPEVITLFTGPPKYVRSFLPFFTQHFEWTPGPFYPFVLTFSLSLELYGKIYQLKGGVLVVKIWVRK